MRTASLALVLFFCAGTAAAQTDPADAAWRAGETDRAMELYEARLANNPNDAIALHRVALMRAWKDQFDESIALFDRLLRVDTLNVAARVDRARVLAWRGETARAIATIDTVLVSHPDFLPALQARAQFASWTGEFGAALQTYDRILAVAPDVSETQYDRARVLGWAARWAEAESAYEQLLARNPNDIQALIGLATLRTWTGDTRAASALYERVLAIDARNLDALRGRARGAAWGGNLPLAELRWHETLAIAPDDPETLAGLAQTLRWQGRDAAALEFIQRALSKNPADAAAREELRLVNVALEPRVTPTIVYESDSDGNRITTFNAAAAFRPRPRLELRGDAYVREARQATGVTFGEQAYGGNITTWLQIEPGWAVSASVGAASGSIADAKVRGMYALSLATPSRHATVASVSARRSVVDGTALLVRRGVTADELSVNIATALPWSVRMRANASVSNLHGDVSDESNTRTAGGASLSRRVHPQVTVVAQGRAFAFERDDLADGYFSPRFYGIGELAGQWQRDRGKWSYNIELAPGLQRIGRDGDINGTARAAAGFTWSARPGRSIGVTLNVANAGLVSLSPETAGGYRYGALTLTSRWSL